MILVLVHLDCGNCPASCWSRLPFTCLDGPVECPLCGVLGMYATPGLPFHPIGVDSLAMYEWYAGAPELIVLDPPEESGQPCRH